MKMMLIWSMKENNVYFYAPTHKSNIESKRRRLIPTNMLDCLWNLIPLDLNFKRDGIWYIYDGKCELIKPITKTVCGRIISPSDEAKRTNLACHKTECEILGISVRLNPNYLWRKGHRKAWVGERNATSCQLCSNRLEVDTKEQLECEEWEIDSSLSATYEVSVIFAWCECRVFCS